MARTRTGITAIVVGGLLVTLGLAFLVSPFASSSPDGLEKVATDEGFIDTAEEHDLADSPLADYGVSGVDDESLSTGLSGVIGVAITLGIALVLFGIFHARRPAAADRSREERSPAAAG
jgi:uncharacterized membrane protein